MLSFLGKLASLSVLALIGVVGLLFYRHVTASQAKIEELQTRTVALQDVITRLGSERRVAEFVVADQERIDGTLRTTLLFVEQDRDGKPMPARSFTTLGNRLHVDALVIKFAAEELENAHSSRNHALLLLEKVYGDRQTPADAPQIDSPDHVPAIYRQSDPQLAAAEKPLWAQFWQMAGDESIRRTHGVKVAHGVGVFVEPRPGVKYTLTLQPDGNVTIYDEPLPPLFDGLMKQPAGR